jgi:hypothetical protein
LPGYPGESKEYDMPTQKNSGNSQNQRKQSPQRGDSAGNKLQNRQQDQQGGVQQPNRVSEQQRSPQRNRVPDSD